MRSLTILLTLAMGSLLAQDSRTTSDAREWLNRGVQAFKNAQYAEAVVDFQKAVDLNNSDATARLYLATAYMQQYIPGAESPENQAMAERADAEFQKVLAVDANNKIALVSLASLALHRKKFDDAQGWYQRVINVDPGNAEAYYSIAFIAWSKWYPAYSKARLQAGMKDGDPGPIKDPAIRIDLQTQYGHVVDEGLWNLEKALQFDPQYDDAMAYMNLFVRERADLRDTREEYARDIQEADRWFQRTIDTKRMKAQGMPQGGSMTGMRTAPPPPPPPPPAGYGQGGSGNPPQVIKIGSNVQQQNLISQTPPEYPALARQAQIEGVVKFSVVIAKDGSIEHIQVVSGHPLLVPAAIEAVKQWRYRPTLLNGEPVAVSTTVDVNFNLPR